MAAVQAAFALPASLVCIPPLIAHLRTRHLAACVLVLGLATVNFFNFINPIIWPTTKSVWGWDGKGLCDVEVKIYIGVSVAITGAITSIFRQLAIVLDTDRIVILPTAKQQRLTLWFETIICLVIPVFTMVMHVFVQYYRYWVVGIRGCTPTFYRSWPTFVFIFPWPVLLCTMAVWYCLMTVYRLTKYRQTVASLLSSSSTMTKTRYAKLFGLSFVLLLVYYPLALYTLIINATTYKIYPYSWSNAHSQDWTTNIPRLAADDPRLEVPVDRWAQIATGYIIFLFFGLGHEARAMYESWVHRCCNLVLPRQPQPHFVSRNSASAIPSATLATNGVDGFAATSIHEIGSMPIHEVSSCDIYEMGSRPEKNDFDVDLEESTASSELALVRSHPIKLA